MLKIFLVGALWLISFVCYASPPPSGIGGVAEHLLEPIGLLSDFVYTACFGIGGAFVFASLIKYIEHRRSPTMVPISTVVFLLISGIVLILLPFLSYVMEGSVRYTLLR